jgi:hypothetical protein
MLSKWAGPLESLLEFERYVLNAFFFRHSRTLWDLLDPGPTGVGCRLEHSPASNGDGVGIGWGVQVRVPNISMLPRFGP